MSRSWYFISSPFLWISMFFPLFFIISLSFLFFLLSLLCIFVSFSLSLFYMSGENSRHRIVIPFPKPKNQVQVITWLLNIFFTEKNVYTCCWREHCIHFVLWTIGEKLILKNSTYHKLGFEMQSISPWYSGFTLC